MTRSRALRLWTRQETSPIGSDEIYIEEDDPWYGSTAYIVKWAVVGGVFFLFIAFMLAGYFHAQSRMKKGLKPLAYHWWLVPKRQRMQFDPVYQNQYMARPVDSAGNGDQQDGYAMHGYAPPPPVYDHNYQNAPPYLHPHGDSKVNPNQADYATTPPPGAPPMTNDNAPAFPAPVAGTSAR